MCRSSLSLYVYTLFVSVLLLSLYRPGRGAAVHPILLLPDALVTPAGKLLSTTAIIAGTNLRQGDNVSPLPSSVLTDRPR